MIDTLQQRDVLGVDVGKKSHRACLVSCKGKLVFNKAVDNKEDELDKLLEQINPDTLIVVDQVRNIGDLIIRRARLGGFSVAYLSGTAMNKAALLFPGDAKTDERDAEVIARTALGIPQALLPAPRNDERLETARTYASQIDFLTSENTRAKNRLRATLFESCPAFEDLVDVSDTYVLNALENNGGPWGIVRSGKRSLGALTRGANRSKVDMLWDSITTSTEASPEKSKADDIAVRQLACRIRQNIECINQLKTFLHNLLVNVPVYQCLLTVPGIGTKTAAQLVISIDIDNFKDHNHLASYCGLAPKNRQSGTSISSVSASYQGQRQLKNLMIFTCNSLIHSNNRFGNYYRACREKGMKHKQALKAVSRKRIKVIYAIMRDEVPYAA